MERDKDAKGLGTDMKESTKRNVQVGMPKGAKLSLYYTSDWIKIPVLRNLCKAACILIPCFLANFIIKENLIWDW